jgi:hypothetical protein
LYTSVIIVADTAVLGLKGTFDLKGSSASNGSTSKAVQKVTVTENPLFAMLISNSVLPGREKKFEAIHWLSDARLKIGNSFSMSLCLCKVE